MRSSILKKFQALSYLSLFLFAFGVMAAETKDTLVLTQQLITPQIQGGSSHLLFLTSGPANDQIFIVDGSEVLRLLATGDIELSNLAPSTVPYIDSGQVLQSSSVTPTELQNVHGSTSALCGITQACTYTGKTISGSSNTLTNIPLSSFTNLGTTTTVLHGNAAGSPTFGAVGLTTDVTGTLPVANGGTGLASGTSGGILGYTASGTLASSAALSQNQLLLGGGAGATPFSLGSLGTTTTLLHGNAAGAPTFGQVGLTTDVTGVLPIANGGTNNGSLAVTAGGVPYTDGSKLVNVGAGTSGFVLTSAGASAPTWKAATAGTKNYLASYNGNTGNGNFELGATTGWTLGTTGTLTNGIPTGSPTFGSGASGNLSISTVTSGSQIAGTYSLTYVSSAATTVGNMLASDAFTIDTEDQAKVMAWQFYYKAVTNPSNANWTGTSSNSLAVAIYDVTNSAWIIPQGNFNLIQSSGVGLASGSFQTSATGTSYRFVIYNANATAGAITDYFDDAQVGPSSSAGSILNTLIASAHITSGTTIVTPNPFNFDTIDTDTTASITTGASWKFTAPFSTYYYVETTLTFGGAADVVLYKNGAKYRVLMTTGASGSAGGTFVQLNAGENIYIAANANAAPSATSAGTIAQSNHISIFIIGNQGAGPPGMVVASRAHVSSGASTTSGNPINFDTIDYDYTGSIFVNATAWKYTCPITGVYEVEEDTYAGAVSANLAVYLNGSEYAGFITSINGANPGGGSTTVPCNAGSTLDIRSPNATFTPSSLTGVTVAQANHVSIFLLQGPSAGSVAAQPVYLTATSTYSVPQMNAVISFSGASFTATLPTAVGFPGRTFTLIHNGTSLTQLYTLATTGGQTIGGIASGSYVMATNQESLSVVSDGANYQIVNHRTNTVWTNSGANTITGITTNPTIGSATVALNNLWWRRIGKNAEIKIEFKLTSAGTSTAGSGDYLFLIPVTADTSIVTAYGGVSLGGGFIAPTNNLGTSFGSYVGTNEVSGGVFLYDSTHVRIGGTVSTSGGAAGIILASSGNFALTQSPTYMATFSVPVSAWQP